jgi:hypothetical protein
MGMKRIIYTIGLLTLLVGVAWVFNAWNAWRVNASADQFNQDVENLFAGLQQFKEHVGVYPQGSNSDVVKALLGQNAKKLIILVGRKNDLNEKGEFMDPWGTPLRIYFSDAGVLVRSAGPNRRFDDSSIIECDDYFRSN